METFVVHIHRRPGRKGAARVLAGVVERTDAAVTRPFANLGELLALLGLPRPASDAAAPRSRHPD